MKLSFSTLGNPDWTFEQTLKNARDMGYQGIEIRGVEGEMLAENIKYFKPGCQQYTKRLLAQYGLQMCGFGSSVSFHDPAKKDEMLAQGFAAIDVCADMGIPAVRIFGNNITDDGEDVIIQRVIEGSQALCDYAAGTAVDILLEVHGDFNTVKRVLSVAEGVKRPNFGILWDVAHSDVTYGDDFMAFFAPIKPYIRHVHIKDHFRNGGQTKLVRLGEGEIPLLPILRQLQRDGYDGWVSLEWEKKWHPDLAEPEVAYPDFIELMKKL